MKTGIALIAGLLVANGTATGFRLDVTGCKSQRNVEKDLFSCPCAGGSGDYDWHFSQLPDGWYSQKDKIIAPKGKFEDRKVYGARVEVLDKRTKESVKKSLFWNFENGKVGKVFDHDFDFDVDFLVPKTKGKNQGSGKNKSDERDDNIKRLFDNADGIGGGNGLGKLRAYFLGNGLYKGDDKNPYLSRLPNDDEVIKVIETGISKEVRLLIVNAARSQVNCKDITGFLQRLLLRLRNKIQNFKDDIDGANKIINTIQEQLKFLQLQLKQAQGSQLNLKDLQAKLKAFKDDLDKILASRDKYQAELTKTNKNIDALQVDVSKFVAESKKIKQQDDKRIRRIDNINDEVSKLEDRIRALKNQKAGLEKERTQFEVRLNQFKARIDATRVRIEQAKVNANDLRAKIKKANQDLDTTRGKITDLQKAIKASDNQQRIKQIQLKILALQKDLSAAQAKIKKIQPLFKDLNDNYQDLAKVGDNNFYGCYKTLYDDNKDQFKQDDDGVVFDGQQQFYDYLNKIFVTSNFGNIRPGDYGTIIFKQVTTTVGWQRIQVKQTNIFTKDWARAYGSPIDDDDNQDDFIGGKFRDNDFGCDGSNGNGNIRGFKGRVQSIRKNVAKVVSDQGVQCNVYLGGCTRIETANKRLPEPGDDIYWRGSNKKGGRSNDYDAHHIACF